MPALLHVDSSADLNSSTSRRLTGLFAETWRGLSPRHSVIERDLHTAPLPHLPDAGLHYAKRLRVAGENPEPAAEKLQEELLAELAAADVVVLGAPMYNWSIPSTLKAWLDHVHVLGTTVPFDTRDQPLAGRPVVVISSRGLEYGPGTADEGNDHTIPPITRILGTSMGMDVTIVTADLTLAGRIPALAALAGRGEKSLEAATRQVQDLATKLGSAV